MFLYDHIAHIGSHGCLKEFIIQLRFPVCAVTSYSNNFGYEQIAHTASVIWLATADSCIAIASWGVMVGAVWSGSWFELIEIAPECLMNLVPRILV